MRVFLSTLLLLATLSGPCLAADIISYPGRVVSETGVPVGGVFTMRFSLHMDPKAPEDIWFEQLFVAVEGGDFLVELGRSKPLPVGTDLSRTWLQVELDGRRLYRVPVDGAWVNAPDKDAGEAPQVCQACDRARTAASAQSLDGLSLKQLTRVVAMNIKPGANPRLSSSIGSQEGVAFKLECPPGHVMTGIQGTSAASVTGMALICRPLEGQQ